MADPAAVLTLNAGSSSLKAALFAPDAVLRASVEGLPEAPHFTAHDASGEIVADEKWSGSPLPHLLDFIDGHLGDVQLAAVGHRVVHGGPRTGPARVSGRLLEALADLTPYAPLHQPKNIEAMNEIGHHRPGLTQVACFDTAFHHTLDKLAARFPIPRALHDAGLRRYGFHGLSFQYIAGQLAQCAPDRCRVIVAHLGNGASLCALRDGVSIDTTMGLTPLDGLMMGTRSGAVDPGLVLALLKDRSAEQVTNLLYHDSGLKGVSGIASDMRKLHDSHDKAAQEAIDLFVFRLAREAGGMAASLGGVDALVFTGGIGEHDGAVREAACARLAWLGIALRPGATEGMIAMPDSPVQVWVIPTDEEQVIADQTRLVLGRSSHDNA
jgi:acetate kinase